MRPDSLYVGGVLYWTLRTRDPDTMLLKDADATPTVAVRKNGSAVGDSVTVTKRSATTGLYDCSYNPAAEAEGDTFEFEERAQVTGTTTAQAYYDSGFVVRVRAVERGTDGANTIAPDNAGIAAAEAAAAAVAAKLPTTDFLAGAATNAGYAALDTAYLFDDGLGRKSIKANVTHYQDILQSNGDLPAKLDAIRTNTNTDIPALINDIPTNSELATALAAADDAVLAAISALNNLSAAQVNAELLDVLNTDTFAELAAPPAASSTLAAKLTWLFMWARNKATQSATERKLYADNGTTVVSTETVSDASGIFTKSEAS